MKKYIPALVLSLLLACNAWGATYYVQEGGAVLAAAKANATACGSNDTTLSVAQHNAATFSAGDTIVLCSDGGTFATTRLIPPSSGTDDATRITYRNATGQTPVFAVATGQQLDTNGKNFITVQGITFTGGTYANAYIQGTTNGFIIQDCIFGISANAAGAVRNVVITAGAGWIFRRNTVYQGTANLGLYGIAGTGITVSDNTFVGVAGQTYTSAIRFDSGVNGLTFSGNTMNGWSLNAVADKLIYFNTCSNVTSSGNTIGSQASPNSGYGYYLNTVTTFSSTDDIIQYQPFTGYMTSTTGFTALRTITRYSSNGEGHGWKVVDSAASFTDTLSNNNKGHGYFISGASTFVGTRVTATANGDSAGDSGLYSQDTATVTCNRCTFSDSFKDGTSVNGGTMTLTNPISFGNGVRDASGNNGNGFTAHGTSTLNLVMPIAYGNTKSGVGNIEASTGNVIGGTFYNNYRVGGTNYGEIYINSSGTQTIKNTIASGPGRALYSYTASGTIVSDYNCFYSSAVAKPFTYKDGTDLTFAEWKTASSQDSHSINADPLLNTTNFKLPGNSPARTGAIPIWTHAEWVAMGGDFYGKYPTGGTLSMGAAQFQKKLIDDLTDDMILKRSKSTDAGSYVQP